MHEPAPGPILQAEGVSKRFGDVTALDSASFAIGRGVTGLLGANGAGKTTMIGLLLGLHAPSTGAVRVFGQDPLASSGATRALVGYSPEHHEVPADVRAHDFVRHIAELHGLPPVEARARASDALWLVGLGEERFRPMGTMSTGQRQRVKLAQAVAHDPRLVMLDEPTNGLDPVQRDIMLDLIRRIGTDFGIDVILSSHLLSEVERICDNAVILSGGRVVAAGRIRDLVGSGSGLVVELEHYDSDVEAALRARGLHVEVDGSVLTLTGQSDLHTVARDVLADADVGIRRLHTGQQTLEDLFLGMVPQ